MGSWTILWRIQARYDSPSFFPTYLHSGLNIISQYAYLTSVPLIWIYSLGFTIIKYRVGYIILPGSETLNGRNREINLNSCPPHHIAKVYPTPYTAWEPAAKAAVFP